MSVDAASFKAAHPEFKNVDDDLVTLKLGDAAVLCPSTVWGDFADMGVRLRTAQALALMPPGRDLRLVNKDGTTVYDEQIDLLVRIVSSGGRII